MEFHETTGGKQFLYGTMPKLAQGVSDIAKNLEQLTNILSDQDKESDGFPARDRLIELIKGIIDHAAVSETISEQVKYLKACGFENEDLIAFGYCKDDMEVC